MRFLYLWYTACMQKRAFVRVVAGLTAIVGVMGLDGGWARAQVSKASMLHSPPEAAPGGTNRQPANGVRRSEPNWFALVDATLHPRPGETIEHAVILIREGRIVGVTHGGEGSSRVPMGPTPIQMTGLHVYAGFIEPWLEIDAPQPAMDAASEHFLKNVTPQRRASTGDWGSSATALRKMGFAAAGIAPKVGVFRGKGAVVSLAEAPEEASLPRPAVLLEDAFHAVSFDRRSEGYPDSLMGAIALVRQTLLDEAWQRERRAAGIDTGPMNAIDALRPVVGEGNASRAVPMFFDTEDELDALRALKIGEEFERPVVIVGSGMEFRRLGGDGRDGLAERIRAGDSRRDGRPGLIVPLTFPEEPDVETPGKAEAVEMRSLMAWEQAPTNPRRLAKAGVAFALTSGKSKDRGGFMRNMRLAIACGLSEDDALAALTTNAARVLGVGDELGTVESGKRANLVVCDGPIFAKKTKVRDVWIDGRRHVISPASLELEGTWDVSLPAGWAASGDWPHTLEATSGGGLTLKREKVEGNEGDGIDAASVSCEKVRTSPTFVDARRGTIEFVFDRTAFVGDGHAGVVVASASVDLSENPSTMRGVMVQPDGTRVEFSATRRLPLRVVGTWRVVEADGKVVAEDDPKAPVIELTRDSATIRVGETTIKATDVTIDATRVRYTYEEKHGDQSVRMDDQGAISGEGDSERLVGQTVLADGQVHEWKAARVDGDDEEGDTPSRARDIPEALPLPFGPYGFVSTPEQGTVLLTGATIWPCVEGESPLIDRGYVLIEAGKIAAIGSGDIKIELPVGATIVACEGKHITPGIVDCHSHTGISKGVNEGGQAITSEVRIADVTDPDSMSWYRQLAGGVTCVNNLHGSANAIGGQSQTNKNRWGCALPDDLHVEGAMPGIKFALGENPRQANGGNGSRYPNTRMGVETLIRDRFTAAREYVGAWKAYETNHDPGSKPRRDLELEALAEVLEGTRIVHCHSYRQDEIVMLCEVARDFGFRIGTFQHILEGYKVADYVRDYSGGGSAFADWWAYKLEVQDAIPEAGAIMHEQGVVVSFNSDSDEMARRLNLEAAKANKYGGVPPVEAMKFVTLNPAKQLKIESRVGSLESGKDADLVVWSGPPLSTMSRVERTYVDGRLLFSLEQDVAAREAQKVERQRLIQKVLTIDAKKPKKSRDRPEKPDRPQPPAFKPGGTSEPSSTTSDADLARQREILRRYNRGQLPGGSRPGECGCGLVHE